ncbi:MAG: phosphate/phosphite/phosphonate ABC transporter substrate-binding protein [Planctomycetota bacterium]
MTATLSAPRRAPIARLALLGLLALLMPLQACSSGNDDAPVLRITALPDHRTTELDPKYSAVAAALSEELGVAVEYVPVADYGASVAAFKGGDVQLAWFGGVTGVQARAAVPGARVIACGRTDLEFRSSFVANVSLGLERSGAFPSGLEGVRFSFGNADSTSGRVMPEHFVRAETGGPPEAFFGEVNLNGGKHPIVARNVETGAWDAGVLNYRTYADLVERGDIDPARCVEIWQTPTYADYNWTAHPALDETFGAGFVDRLQSALVGITDPALLDALQRPEGLATADNDDFRALAELCQELGLVSG